VRPPDADCAARSRLRLKRHINPAARIGRSASADGLARPGGGAQPSRQPHGFDVGGAAARRILGTRRQPSGGLSHAKAGRDVRRCHPGGDSARHRRYRDGSSAQQHGVGQGTQNSREDGP